MPSIAHRVAVLAYVHSYSVNAVVDRLAAYRSGEDAWSQAKKAKDSFQFVDTDGDIVVLTRKDGKITGLAIDKKEFDGPTTKYDSETGYFQFQAGKKGSVPGHCTVRSEDRPGMEAFVGELGQQHYAQSNPYDDPRLKAALGNGNDKEAGIVYQRLWSGSPDSPSLHEVSTKLMHHQIAMEKQIYDYKRACQAATLQLVQLSEMIKHSFEETNLIMRQKDTLRLKGIVDGRRDIKTMDAIDMKEMYADDISKVRRGKVEDAAKLKEMDEAGRLADIGASHHSNGLLAANAQIQNDQEQGIGNSMITGLHNSNQHGMGQTATRHVHLEKHRAEQ